MAPEQALVVALIRALAQPVPDRLALVRRLASAVDPERVVALLAAHRVLTSLGPRLVGDPGVGFPTRLASRVREAHAAARRRGVLNHTLTSRIAGLLEARGIPVVALKGSTLAETAYGDLGARESSDLDVLIPHEDLDEAVEALGPAGWREPAWLPEDPQPRLHRYLSHSTLPAVELHWRVHWYEEAFAQQALRRAASNGLRRLQPADELSFLLLFLARDGFAGLRQTLDVVAWWAARGNARTTARVGSIAATHPALAPALMAAAFCVEERAALARGTLLPPDRPLTRRERAAVALGNPWMEGPRPQIEAEISLVDGLLSPPAGAAAFTRRQLLPSDAVLMGRRRELRQAGRARMTTARASHAMRVLARYAVAPPRVIARRRR